MEKIGGLIWSLPNDLKFFKEKTTGKKVFMGKNTFKSLPKKLPNREHFVLTDEPLDVDSDINLIYDLNEFIQNNKDTLEEVFVIGGGMVYTQLLPYAKKMYLTEIDSSCEDASVYFPKFEKDEFVRKELYKNNDGDITYTHVEYLRK